MARFDFTVPPEPEAPKCEIESPSLVAAVTAGWALLLASQLAHDGAALESADWSLSAAEADRRQTTGVAVCGVAAALLVTNAAAKRALQALGACQWVGC